MKDLKKLDVMVRYFVKKWIRLPKDLSTSIVHAIENGGLGVRSMTTMTPRLRLGRKTESGSKQIRNPEIKTKTDEARFWKDKLEQSVDGPHLALQSGTVNTARWIVNGTSLMSGADYIRAIKIRTKSIMTKVRRRRYTKLGDTSCEAGCSTNESLNHIMQKCPRTWSARTKRHDGICKFLESILLKKDLKPLRETPFRVGKDKQEGLKPDLIVAVDGVAQIMDVTVVSDCEDKGMMMAYRNKREKYQREDLMKSVMESLPGTRTANVLPLVLSYRGIILRKSAEHMTNILKISQRDMEVIVVKALGLGSKIVQQFDRCTTVHEAV